MHALSGIWPLLKEEMVVLVEVSAKNPGVRLQ